MPFASPSKRVFERKNSYGSEFHLQDNFHANQTHFNEKGFARRLVFKWGTKLNGNKLKVFRCSLAPKGNSVHVILK